MIYLVEDDNSIRELVIYTLQQAGLKARGFSCAQELWTAIKDGSIPRLILLDIMLPDEDGLSILRKLRASGATKTLPIVMLTARDSEFDKVVGLDSGADDYIPKPFGMMELVARVKALLRRTGNAQSSGIFKYGILKLDTDRYEVHVSGNLVILTLKEFELLLYLMKNQGIVLTRDKLLSTLWGYEFEGATRTVDVHIRTLRQKLGAAGDYIKTIRGVGYKLEESR